MCGGEAQDRADSFDFRTQVSCYRCLSPACQRHVHGVGTPAGTHAIRLKQLASKQEQHSRHVVTFRASAQLGSRQGTVHKPISPAAKAAMDSTDLV